MPYRRTPSDSDDDENDILGKEHHKTQLDKLRNKVLGRSSQGRGPNALNVGARGHAKQREYEAGRPGDYPAPPASSDDNV